MVINKIFHKQTKNTKKSINQNVSQDKKNCPSSAQSKFDENNLKKLLTNKFVAYLLN